ncbi:aquaporin, partial [Salmonella sp. s51228]|uniref:aquaporin n=1 Tax=Salmonella sp. s51228 TaxID=3159652 RepID=UPI00397FCD12
DQFFSSFLLLFLILAIFDKPNSGLVHYLKPIGVALIIFAVSICFAHNCGGAMNPIRDFPPRCFASIFWGQSLFKLHSYYFLIPLLAPLVGGPLGAIVYIFFIETHHYPASEPTIVCRCFKKLPTVPENGIC